MAGKGRLLLSGSVVLASLKAAVHYIRKHIFMTGRPDTSELSTTQKAANYLTQKRQKITNEGSLPFLKPPQHHRVK